MPVRTGKKGKKSAFEMLEDFQAGVKDEEEDDAPGGGLMVRSHSDLPLAGLHGRLERLGSRFRR